MSFICEIIEPVNSTPPEGEVRKKKKKPKTKSCQKRPERSDLKAELKNVEEEY